MSETFEIDKIKATLERDMVRFSELAAGAGTKAMAFGDPSTMPAAAVNETAKYIGETFRELGFICHRIAVFSELAGELLVEITKPEEPA